MRILCTFPGRYGDVGWALPTVRAISEHFGVPVDLQIAGEFAPILDLLRQQPYLGQVWALPSWSLTPPDEWQPPRLGEAEGEYDHVYHLGYRGWPERHLPFQTYSVAVFDYQLPLAPLDLTRPWIVLPSPADLTFFPLRAQRRIAVGFTDCWFELKLGLLHLMDKADVDWAVEACMHNERWTNEAGLGMCSWVEAATCISQADVVLADCSALHVLAVAMGKPVVVYEPMAARHNPIFWPVGMDGPQVRIVRGGDGQPTIDARHTADLLREVLRAR